MKSDILFFNPPQTKRGDSLQNRALLWIASYLQQNGFKVRVFYLGKSFQKTIKRALESYQPRNVAVSCKWYTNLYGALVVAQEIRKFNPGIRIITGGQTAAYFDKELLETGYFDLVIRGDAELPLLHILSKKTPINCSLKIKNCLKRYPLNYSQAHNNLVNYTLSRPTQILENATQILKGGNFIWTGKGCSGSCFYCAGSSSAQKNFFGRKSIAYRPIPDVLTDIAILSDYSRDLMFDFACPPGADDYYLQLFKKITPGKFRVNFFHWSLPSKKFMDKISSIFQRALIHLDTSTLCEQLRLSLSRKKLLKPFFSNQDIEEVVKYCQAKNNLRVCLENIVGLPGENQEQVEAHISFAYYLVQKYPALADISYLPLSAEPGALTDNLAKKLGLNLCRRTFVDYLKLTQKAFEANITYPYSGFFRCKHLKGSPISPYGIYQKGINQRSSYNRANFFMGKLGRELAASRVVYRYQFSRKLYRALLPHLAVTKR